MKKLSMKRIALVASFAVSLCSFAGVVSFGGVDTVKAYYGGYSASSNDWYSASSNDYEEEAPVVVEKTYADVEQDKWYTDAIKTVSRLNIMTGYSGTENFGVEDSLSRAQFATILYRLAGSPAVSYEAKFDDVPDGYYFSAPIMWCSQTGIASGYSGTKLFGTNDNITREALATMLYRFAAYQGKDLTASADVASFADGAEVSGFAKTPFAWCASKGIVTGKKINETYYLSPQAQASRAECATMICRYIKY